jgi:hypothetical protein
MEKELKRFRRGNDPALTSIAAFILKTAVHDNRCWTALE